MISDPIVLQELQTSWDGVRKLRDKVQLGVVSSLAQGASATFLVADIAYNLPFVHACSVLNEVLLQLRDEKHFKCKSIFLGALMESSKNELHWHNFDLVKKGVERRNDIAHHADIVSRGDCWKFIDAIELELIAWKIIASR